MKVLVTGGAGFIGHHLCCRLLKEGHEVVIVDSFHAYYAVERKRRQVAVVEQYGAVKVYEQCLLHKEETCAIFRAERPDVVYHLAAIPGVPKSLAEPELYVDYDIKATVHVLEAAKEANVQHVLFASSSSVYGDQEAKPLTEADVTGDVTSPYAAAKLSAELYCRTYAMLYKMQMTIFRYFTVYGPSGRPDMAIAKFIRQALNDEAITVYQGATARDYTYVDDIVSGMVKALDGTWSCETFNLGAGEPISLTRLVETVRDYFPQLQVEYAPFRQGDVMTTWADVTKARRLLGYEVTVPFDEGMKRTIEWARTYEIH